MLREEQREANSYVLTKYEEISTKEINEQIRIIF